jgi:hypothetical protein
MSHELSSPAQQLFLAYYEERGYFKGYGQFMLNRKSGHFATSANSNFASWKSHQSALGGCASLHQQSTRERDHEIWD